MPSIRPSYPRFDLIRFTSAKYVNDFLDGKIYMNSIGYFIENGFEDQKDYFEGVSYYEDPNTSEFAQRYDDRLKAALTGDIAWVNEGSKYCNVACFYKLNRYKNQVELVNSDIFSFGEVAIHIFDVHQFLERVIRATGKRKDFYWCAGNVNYYNPDNTNVRNHVLDCFCKTQKHSYQREWRIAVLNQYSTLKQLAEDAIEAGYINYTRPFVLEIGVIRDIARSIPADELSKNQAKFFPKQTMVKKMKPIKRLTPKEVEMLLSNGIRLSRNELEGAYWGNCGNYPRIGFDNYIDQLANGYMRPMLSVALDTPIEEVDGKTFLRP